MKDFFIFCRRVVRDRAMLVTAMVCAVISALGMGAGIIAMVPAIKLIADEAGMGNLPGYAHRFNEARRTLPILDTPILIPQWLIDVVPQTRLGGVIFVVSFIGVLTVVGAAFNFLHQYLSITVAARTVANARLSIFSTAMHMPLIRVNTRGASAFVAKIINDSAAIQRGLIALMSKTVAHGTQGLVAFAVALFIGRSLTVAALVLLPLLAIVLRQVGKRIRRGTRGALRRQEDLLRLATESVQGLRTVKASTAEARAIDRFAKVNIEVVREELRARLARALSGPLVELIAVLGVGVLVVFAAREIIDQRLTLDRFVLALGSLGLAANKFKMIAGLINELQASGPPAKRMLELLDEAYEEPRDAKRPDLPRHERSIAFKNVSLTYPGATERAVDDLSLDIPHGNRIAIVGPNGCGKTTLLGMLPRLLKPDSGSVHVDGVDLATVSMQSVRTQMAVVAQETVLFRGSIADNIAFGLDFDRSEIEQAARRAHAHEFISHIPGGYDADVAEQGHSLSGGQRQRIAIARAILRDPSILILDEATSQIDAESEAHIAAAITEFARGRTVLLIAHRLATVVDADRIVVMERGTIIDQGRHDELRGRCALYRRLTHTQLRAG
jgi:ABC-type multidrug transport system fused ATPase/permease subunit